MSALRLFTALLLLAAGYAGAQTPGEISFWETVRDSRNPAELQAYLQTFPNGMFAPIARARLAALEKSPPPVPAARPVAPAVVPAPPVAAVPPPRRLTIAERMPQVGDTWTYRLSYPRQPGQPIRPPSTYIVKLQGISQGTITDQISIDGATPSSVVHSRELTLAPQVVSLFSPYLIAMRDLPARGWLGTVSIEDTPCTGQYGCRAGAKVLGTEEVTVPAGKFVAKKVLIDETWWPASPSGHMNQVSQMNGGRNLTIWYVPELKRAVKFASRITVGDIPPIEANFDLDLVSYQMK
jgi:hypothetical protein